MFARVKPNAATLYLNKANQASISQDVANFLRAFEGRIVDVTLDESSEWKRKRYCLTHGTKKFWFRERDLIFDLEEKTPIEGKGPKVVIFQDLTAYQRPFVVLRPTTPAEEHKSGRETFVIMRTPDVGKVQDFIIREVPPGQQLVINRETLLALFANGLV